MSHSIIRAASLATGTYRLARLVNRHLLDRRQLRIFREEVALYKSLIPHGALCFDVGANTGARAEALLEAGARVVAFEPQPECARELYARCKPYRQLNVVRAALGEGPSIGTLFVRRMHLESGLLEDWEGTIVGRHDVPVLTLDLAIARFGKPYYCKIDVEGYEYQVLSGLTQQIPLLSLEYHLTANDVEKTRRCAARLGGFGEYFVNVCPAETPRLRFDRWRPLDELPAWFPGDLAGDPGFSYGDLMFCDHLPAT